MYQPNPMSIQTSITPTGIYNPRQTRGAVNQAVADSYASNNAYEAQKRYSNRGVSRGLSATRNMLPSMINGRLGAANAMATMPFADEQANAQQMLAGQVGREGEALGWGGLGYQNQANAASNFNRKQDMGWSLFNQLMGY